LAVTFQLRDALFNRCMIGPQIKQGAVENIQLAIKLSHILLDLSHFLFNTAQSFFDFQNLGQRLLPNRTSIRSLLNGREP